ncbi:MAG: class A beta-lactamase [Sphingobium sp.]|nr:class A beta-lactamase [Sphingobium sp.]
MPLLRLLSTPLLALAIAALPSPSLQPLAPDAVAADSLAARLQADFARIAAASDGRVAVAVRSMDDGRVLGLHPERAMPMASTVKLAVAGKILSMVDAGHLKLTDTLPITFGELVDSDNPVGAPPLPSGHSLSVLTLMELMMMRSDNSATDVLMARAGGPKAVNQWLADGGIHGIRVDSSIGALLLRAMGTKPAPGVASYRDMVRRAKLADPTIRERDRFDIPNDVFASDPRDTASPHAMLDLIGRIRTAKLISRPSADLLISIMARCKTGNHRIRGALPPGTPVAHKTGSLNGTGNDVGIVTLPDGRAFAVAVFIAGDRTGAEVRDRVIADMARAAYDYYRLVDA